MSFAGSIRMDLILQWLVTVFLAFLFWFLYARFQRLRFFRHWTVAWFAFSIFVGVSVVYTAGMAQPWEGILEAVGLAGGFFQIAYLFYGVESFREPDAPERRRMRWGLLFVLLGVGASLWLSRASVIGFPKSQEAATLRQFCLLLMYAYAGAVFLGHWRTNRSRGAMITSVACLVLAAHQLYYVGLGWGFALNYFPAHWRIAPSTWEAMNLVDTAGELGIALGMVQLLIEEYSRLEFLGLANERSRRIAESRYRTLVEQLQAITYIRRPDGDRKLFYLSPQIETILGFKPEEWLADPQLWFRRIHPDDLSSVEAALAEAAIGKHFHAEYRVYARDGRIVWLHETAVPVADPAGGPPLFHGLALDVTERRQMEVRLYQSQKMEAIGKLAGGVAHDFNNLLTVIKGFSSVLMDRLRQSPDLCRNVESIEHAASKAEALTRQLLAFGRKQVLQPQTVSLNDVVHDIETMLQLLVGAAVKVKFDLRSDLGAVRADPGQIEQVILNLAANSRDAMPQGGDLIIESRNVELDQNYRRNRHEAIPGRYAMIAVTDTGVGMGPATQAHLFEPFFTTKEMGKGTGLGLATVYGIIKQSNGFIWAYSEVGRGTTFKIYLPRVDAPTAQFAGAKNFKPVAAEGAGAKILLVEDDHQVRELAAEILSSSGYSVLVAKDATEVECHCSAGHRIDLLLSDVIMPGVSGPELAKRVTAKYPEVKVMFMSGYTDSAIAEFGWLEPGTLLLEKPFTPSALLAKVRDALAPSCPVA